MKCKKVFFENNTKHKMTYLIISVALKQRRNNKQRDIYYNNNKEINKIELLVKSSLKRKNDFKNIY